MVNCSTVTPTVTPVVKGWAIALAICLSLTVVLPAQAAVLCRPVDTPAGTQQVCILRITRSAKHFWEYRAAVQVGDETRPVEVYDCRAQVRIRHADAQRVPFAQDPAGPLICQYFNKS